MRITRPIVLLALAALMAPRVEASRTGVWESNPPAAVLTKTDAAGLLAPLAPAGPLENTAANADLTELPRFDLGAVVLVERELEREEHFDLGPLTLVDLNLLRGPPSSYPETRVGGFELLPPFRVGASPSLSLWSRRACGSISCGLVSDSPEDPWGLFDPAKVGHGIRSFFGPLKSQANALWAALPTPVRAGYEMLHQQQPMALPTPEFALSAAEDFLAAPFEIGEGSGTAIGEGRSGLEVAAAVGQDVSDTIFTGMAVAGLLEKGGSSVARRVAPDVGDVAAGIDDWAREVQAQTGPTRTGPPPSPNRGIKWVEEAQTAKGDAAIYQDEAPGARSSIGGKREVPALQFDNPNKRGVNQVRLDGQDPVTGELVDRKRSITGHRKQTADLARLAEAMRQNPGVAVRIEVPTSKVQKAAQARLRRLGMNVPVRVAP